MTSSLHLCLFFLIPTLGHIDLFWRERKRKKERWEREISIHLLPPIYVPIRSRTRSLGPGPDQELNHDLCCHWNQPSHWPGLHLSVWITVLFSMPGDQTLQTEKNQLNHISECMVSLHTSLTNEQQVEELCITCNKLSMTLLIGGILPGPVQPPRQPFRWAAWRSGV